MAPGLRHCTSERGLARVRFCASVPLMRGNGRGEEGGGVESLTGLLSRSLGVCLNFLGLREDSCHVLGYVIHRGGLASGDKLSGWISRDDRVSSQGQVMAPGLRHCTSERGLVRVRFCASVALMRGNGRGEEGGGVRVPHRTAVKVIGCMFLLGIC